MRKKVAFSWANGDKYVGEWKDGKFIEKNSMETDNTEQVGKEQDNKEHDSIRKHKEAKKLLDDLHDSLKIIGDFGDILGTKSQEGFFMAESRLPYSKEKIEGAIVLVETFIKCVLSDEDLKKRFIEDHYEFKFSKAKAEWLLSEKSRVGLKVGLEYLDMFVSDEKAEDSKKMCKELDYLKEKEFEMNEYLTSERGKEFFRITKKISEQLNYNIEGYNGTK